MNTTTASTTTTSQARWAAASGFFGAIAEYYDFALYAPAAALLFGPLFFEPLGAAGSVAASLATFGVAYLARPLGAITFGSIGDKYGRRPALLSTLALMGAATFCIGLLPTYETAGWIAPALLVLLRICQGLAAGVEQSGSGTLSAEHAPARKRGVYTSYTMIGVSIGWFAGPAVMSPIAANEQFLMSGGWRIPFLLALPLAALALWVRWHVTEPNAAQKDFTKTNTTASAPVATSAQTVTEAKAASPLVTVVRDHLGNLLRVVGASLHMLVGVTCNVFVVGYAVNKAGMDRSAILAALSFAGLTTAFTQPFFAWVSDKIGRKPVFITSCLGLIVGLPLVMLAVESGSTMRVAIALTCFYLVVMAGNVVQASFYPELFPADVRFTGVSVGTQVGLVIVGFSPLIYQRVINDGLHGWWPGAVFAGICWLVAAICAATAKPVAK